MTADKDKGQSESQPSEQQKHGSDSGSFPYEETTTRVRKSDDGSGPDDFPKHSTKETQSSEE
jgi:hypothetical protein